MAVIKVLGPVYSPSTQRVLACLFEKGVEFELAPMDMSGGAHNVEPLFSLNPFGRVPALEHGGLRLFESRVINQYLVHEFPDKGTQLICPGSEGMAHLSMWMEVEAYEYDRVASKLAWELAFKPLFGVTADAAVVEENEARLAEFLDVYELRLSQSRYLAGDSFSLADMHHLPVTQVLLWTQTKMLFDSRPHVSAWVAAITARPAWAKVLALQNRI